MQRGQLINAGRINDHDKVIIEGITLTVATKHHSPGRIPADGNRKIEIFTYEGITLRARTLDPVRVLRRTT